MSAKFKKVTRFVCQWCGKDFKTDRLHDCKWDPDKRNCLSCVHQVGSDTEETSDGCGRYSSESHFVCDKEDYPDIATKFNDIRTLQMNKWNGDCPKYEAVPNWNGKETFRERRQEGESSHA